MRARRPATAGLVNVIAASLPLGFEVELVRRLYEVGLFGLFLLVMARSAATRGVAVTTRELVFGFVLSQSVELVAVAQGRYLYPDWLVYFPPWPAWVPLGIGLGWAALLPCVMRVSERVLGPSTPPVKLAALDGSMALGLDLILDPAVSGEPLHMWLWSGAGMTPYRYWLLDVPIFNFVGWFVLVFAGSLQLRRAEAIADARRRFGTLALYLAIDLVITFVILQLPW